MENSFNHGDLFLSNQETNLLISSTVLNKILILSPVLLSSLLAHFKLPFYLSK